MTTAASPASVSLYGHWICPFATRVAFALAERRIEHDLVDVPPSAVRPKGFVLPPEFVEHTPRLEIPMVRVDDEFLADSIPILGWLDVRLEGLRRLGFGHPLPRRVEDHRRRCQELDGWSAVVWSDEQTDELVGRFEAHRRRARASA
jgi:glutathione S-transferase